GRDPAEYSAIRSVRTNGGMMRSHIWIFTATTLLGISTASAQPDVRDHRRGPPPPAQLDPGPPREAPPPPRVEKVGRRAGWAWVEGNWEWRHGKWEWHARRWEKERHDARSRTARR